jgi:hypothetical protein
MVIVPAYPEKGVRGRMEREAWLASVPHFSFSPPGDPKVVPVGETADQGAGAHRAKLQLEHLAARSWRGWSQGEKP